MRRLFPVLLLSVFCHVAAGAGSNDLASALRAAGRGRFDYPAVVEVEGFYKGGFQAVVIFSSGVGIAQRQRQFTVGPDAVKGVFKALDRFRFATMPELFGGKPRLTHKPEVRSAVTVRLGPWEKGVMQARDGEQSEEFAKLVQRIFAILEKPMAQGISVASLHEGLLAIAEGKLAPETLSLTLAWEEQPKTFSVYALFGLHVSWTPGGSAEVKRYWLSEAQVRELSKLLLALSPERGFARFSWPKKVSLEVAVLNHRWSVTGQQWASGVVQGEEAWVQRWQWVEDEVRRIFKEGMLVAR